MKRPILAVLLVLLLPPPGAAHAQTSVVGHDPNFTVERLAPAPGPGGFLHVEDATLASHLALSLNLVSTFAERPLVIRRAGLRGGELTEPVAWRLSSDLGVAVGLWGWLQVGLALPVVVVQGGDRLSGLELMEPGVEEGLAPVTVGDLRVHVKADALRPRHGYGLGIGADLVVTLPTGDDTEFAGEAGFVVEARAIASLRRARWAAALNVGPRLRSRKVRFFNPNLVMGHELAWGAAGSVRLPFLREHEPVVLGEVAGVAGGGDGPSPAEARLGVRARVSPAWTVGLAGGLGIGDVRAIGAPAWRAALELRWDRRPPADLDEDDVPDALDRCPASAEDPDHFQDGDGCPDDDNDRDGVADVVDRCPNEPEDRDRFQDTDGCPDPDNDGDGLPDVADRCPFEPEDRDGFADDDGCPDKDNDADGVLDAEDRCPLAAEDRDGHDDADGCPDLDDDGDGVPDATDTCLTALEDRDGWEDDDGCPDLDDDRDGVPDARDRCPDAPETIRTPEDTEDDGCPDGKPMAEALPDGTVLLTDVAARELRGGPRAGRVAAAIARAARRAGWDQARGEVLVVTVPGDGPTWSRLADRRSNVLVHGLEVAGVRARVEAVRRPAGVVVRATPEALAAGRGVKVRGR